MDRRELLRRGAFAAGIGALSTQSRAEAQGAGFFFRPGDRVVMIGDSITEQLLHSNYVESYVLSRFPEWPLAFRNVGIGGDTSTGGNRRTERDILSFRPTAVTITFGMNDGGYRRPYDPARLQAYVSGLQGMADQLKKAGVRTAILSSSPVEKAEDGPALEGYNETLQRLAQGAREVAERNGLLFVDQFRPHVAALNTARSRERRLRINGGDPVHPGPTGQLLMAWAILLGLGGGPTASSLHLDAGSGFAGTRLNCEVTGLRLRPNGLAFIRTDRALPWYMAPEARPILSWAPVLEDLNQYVLRVTGLKGLTYHLLIDDERCATLPAADLEAGVNLALLDAGPVYRQARELHEAVFAKNRYYHDRIFRGVVLNNAVPPSEKPQQIQSLMPGMAPLEAAIQQARLLRPKRWELIQAT